MGCDGCRAARAGRTSAFSLVEDARHGPARGGGSAFPECLRHALALCAEPRGVSNGRYNHLNGITNNNTPFPADSVNTCIAVARRRI